MIGDIARAFGGDPPEAATEIEANVELVATLLTAARRGEPHAFPTAIVLPAGNCPDDLRWLDALGWHPLPPAGKALLTVPEDADFNEMAVAAYELHSTMAAAAVAFHF